MTLEKEPLVCSVLQLVFDYRLCSSRGDESGPGHSIFPHGEERLAI